MFIQLIINRGERIVEFFLGFAFGLEPRLLPEGESDFGGSVGAEVWQVGPDPSEWGTEARNDGSWDTTEGETLKFVARPSQAQGCRWEWRGCTEAGFDVQSNLMLEHVGVENDSDVSLETFPDHPPKGNAGKTVALAILNRSAPNI